MSSINFEDKLIHCPFCAISWQKKDIKWLGVKNHLLQCSSSMSLIARTNTMLGVHNNVDLLKFFGVGICSECFSLVKKKPLKHFKNKCRNGHFLQEKVISTDASINNMETLASSSLRVMEEEEGTVVTPPRGLTTKTSFSSVSEETLRQEGAAVKKTFRTPRFRRNVKRNLFTANPYQTPRLLDADMEERISKNYPGLNRLIELTSPPSCSPSAISPTSISSSKVPLDSKTDDSLESTALHGSNQTQDTSVHTVSPPNTPPRGSIEALLVEQPKNDVELIENQVD